MEREISMRKNRCFKLIVLLLALSVMFSGMMPVALAAEDTFKTGLLIEETVLDDTFVQSATVKDTDGKTVTDLTAADPNKAYRLTLAVSEPAGAQNAEEMLPENTDEVDVVYYLENMTAEDGSNGVVSWEYDRADGALVFSWVNGKPSSFTAEISVTPSVPAENDLSGSYMLISRTNAMVSSIPFTDGGRNRLKSIPVTIEDGTVRAGSTTSYTWVLKQVSGNYYTVSTTAGEYLRIVPGSNSVLLEKTDRDSAQKILVESRNGGFTFRYGGNGLNNSNNNNTKGFASWSAGSGNNEIFDLFAPSALRISTSLVFNINGGTASDVPQTVMGDVGDVVTLPSLNSTKSGRRFIGWAEVSNIYSRVAGTNHTYHEVFLPGSTYTLKEGTNTLYAVYNPSTTTVQFGIRADGVIQDEPNGYDVSSYKGHFKVNGILREGHWAIDIDSTKPVKDYYVDNDVIACLNWVPSAEEIAEALKREGNIDFDPETQYIHYYVLKCTSESVWKVDGVIRNKAKIGITYNTNVPATEKSKIASMPGGYQVVSGTEILIGTGEDSEEILTPERAGYVFTGWNTEPDGTGTSYSAGKYIRLTNNLNLYAQWNAETEQTITITPSWPNGKPAPNGTIITLTANLVGFDNLVEGKDYILQWQYSVDLETWTDEPKENGHTFTYELNAETALYTWRVVARALK